MHMLQKSDLLIIVHAKLGKMTIHWKKYISICHCTIKLQLFDYKWIQVTFLEAKGLCKEIILTIEERTARGDTLKKWNLLIITTQATNWRKIQRK